MSETTPKIAILGPISPSTSSVRSERLEYEKLAPAAAKHRPFEYTRMRAFWDAEDGSLEEQAAAQELALHYVLMGALALDRAGKPEQRDKLSHWYTRATSEIYGIPEDTLARKLFSEQKRGATRHEELAIFEAAQQVGDYMLERYQPVYEALELESAPEHVDPEDMARRFEAGIAVLANQYDDDWQEWIVERDVNKNPLSVNAAAKKVTVGLQRARVTPNELKQLFSHEVLVHGLRAVNGLKQSELLGKGLPGYIDAEEGLGVFIEYAVGGTIKDAVIDRYVDIAYALGLIDGKEHTRAELLDLAMTRAVDRNQGIVSRKTDEDIKKEVYAHVNRIYHGSGGDEHVGIFTKDIAYYKGFLTIGRYIAEQLEHGVSIETVMEYLTSAKFDPTNQAHSDLVGSGRKAV